MIAANWSVWSFLTPVSDKIGRKVTLYLLWCILLGVCLPLFPVNLITKYTNHNSPFHWNFYQVMAWLGRSQIPRWRRCRLSSSYSSNLRHGVGSREHSWWYASGLLLLEPCWRFPDSINLVYLQTVLRGVRVKDSHTCPYTMSWQL